MNINGNNNNGQEQVVTKGRLKEYVQWLNESVGGSYLKFKAFKADARGYRIRVYSILGSGDDEPVVEPENGIGTVYFVTQNGTEYTGTPSESQDHYFEIPGTKVQGKAILRNGNKFYNQIRVPDLSNVSIGSEVIDVTEHIYSSITFNDDYDDKPDIYCLTCEEISGGTYARYYDEEHLVDGIIIDNYSVSDGKAEYSSNQLVVEKDVNFGNFDYELELNYITVEVDAMNDTDEYLGGVIPYIVSESAYTSVDKVVKSGSVVMSREPLTSFNLVSGLTSDFSTENLKSANFTDNETLTRKKYTTLSIASNGRLAKAPIVDGHYSLDVYYYNDNNELTSTTITASTSNGASSSVTASTKVSTKATERSVTINISKSGLVRFEILQRPEIYGYFPVEVYHNSINGDGNVELSASSRFVEANSVNNSEPNGFNTVNVYSYGWLSNAGDNFGQNALVEGKKSLQEYDTSVYVSVLEEQGLSDGLCGKDVYNTNDTVYDRGVKVGTYHIPYADDAYDGAVSGFSGTKHLYTDSGYLSENTPSYSCTNKYLDYSFDPFLSEYTYHVSYTRLYYKTMHSYGITSILRRFRKIDGQITDSAKNSYEPSLTFHPYNIEKATPSGNSFPKHIASKNFRFSVACSFNEVSGLTSGGKTVSAWTTVYETKVIEGVEQTNLPTTRNVTMEWDVSDNSCKVNCQKNEKRDTVYIGIAPRFYMVDAETCVGISANYDFYTGSNYVEDKTNTEYDGTDGELRRFYLSGEWFLKGRATERSSTQQNYKPMVTYYNAKDDDGSDLMIKKSSRYGYSGCSIKIECCPSAPIQNVLWVDEYAPTDSGGTIFQHSNLAFLDENEEYVPNGETPSLSAFTVPGVKDEYWQYYKDDAGYGYTKNYLLEGAVNKDYTDSSGNKRGGTYYSFTGQKNYKDLENVSSKNVVESMSYAFSGQTVGGEVSALTYYNDINSEIGYSVQSGYEDAYYAVNNLAFNGSGIYTGNSYVYVDENNQNIVQNKSDHNSDPHYFQPIVKNRELTDGEALRDCNGDMTLPFWSTDIYFTVRYDEDYRTTVEQDGPVSAFKIKPTLEWIDYSGNTITSVTFNNSGSYVDMQDSQGRYSIGWVKEENINDVDITVSDYTYGEMYDTIQYKRFIFFVISEEGSPLSIDNEYLQPMKIQIIFSHANINMRGKMIDYLKFNVHCTQNALIGTNNPCDLSDQVLAWNIDLGNKVPVGGDIFVKLSLLGWGSYNGNGTRLNERGERCIGTKSNHEQNYDNSVLKIMTEKQKSFYDINNFGRMSKYDVLTDDYYDDNHPTSHEGLYW